MNYHSILGLAITALMAPGAALAAETAPSYTRDVKPFLIKYCGECHNSSQARGGLDIDSFPALMAGGNRSVSVVSGRPDESPLVLLVEGKDRPVMPPRRSKQPRPEEIGILRAWVAAGARDDSPKGAGPTPDVRPRLPVGAPVTALAYRPDGKVLAAAVQRLVVWIDPAGGDVTGQLSVPAGRVTAVAFRPDGRKLAVASGSVGTAGEIRIYSLSPDATPAATLEHTVPAHADLVHDLAFSPDGATLASCSYDRLVKLWDAATGKELKTLKDHSDSVFGVAFSPDGRLIASAAADRAVKVWDVATGRRLYTLGEATDWVYAVAWSPQGNQLAAGGVDKSIRVWEATPAGSRLIRSAFAHEGAITRLVYARDGKALYSLSEDRTAKAWTAATLVERTVYVRQPETALSLALRAEPPQLALGRYDGVVQLLDPASGKVLAEPLPVKPRPPALTRITPASGVRGQKLQLTFEGTSLRDASEVTCSYPGTSTRILPDGRTASRLVAEVDFPAQAPAGVYQLGLKSATGKSAPVNFTVDLFRTVSEPEQDHSANAAQAISLPVSVLGKIGRAGQVDSYRFVAKAGQQVGVQVLAAATGSKLDPVLWLVGPAGAVVATGKDGLLGHTCASPGDYTLNVRDREYRGGAEQSYRLHVGEIPVVTEVYPLGLQRGTSTDVHVRGVYLNAVESVRVTASADAAPGSRLPVPVASPLGSPLGNPGVVVGEFPEVLARTDGAKREELPALQVPGTANGRIATAHAAETWRFSARRGERLIVEVRARPLGSPLDSFIEILDHSGRPVPRAVLRCLAKTFTTFRDHDSAGTGIRMEAWNELAINDYLWVGNELLRIHALPKNPDDDCQFWSVGGQRLGFLDTTPNHLSMGTPMYKVEVHPPGKTFPPNGFPVIALPYRNDDGGPGYGKDSRLFFDPPADGEYQVRVTDAEGRGGSGYAYRLTVRPPRPDFRVHFSPTGPAVWKGGAVPISVTADRIDGFDGAIDLRLENLPAGFSAPETTIPAGETTTAFALFADTSASAPEKSPALKLVARARIGGRDVMHDANGGVPKAVEPGDLVTATEQPEVRMRPGQEARLTVKIERRQGHTGRVPLDVRGLPHGVRVLDIGLNGILITEKETSRTVVIYAEPWVEPTAHPFVVLARSERKGTEHAARSVLLRVSKE